MIFLLLLAIIVALCVSFLLYWPFYGAPYVPTQSKEIAEILKRVKLAKGQVFCDLGCGDGRLVFAAAKITKSLAIGLDINWGLIQWCKLRSNEFTQFYCQNIFKQALPKANIYYLYFWPGMVEKIADKIKSLNIKNTIVTKAFEIKHLKSRFSFKINGNQFWVY